MVPEMSLGHGNVVEPVTQTGAVEVDRARLRAVDVPLLVASTNPLNALGWKAEKSLSEALQDLWNETAEQGPATG